MNRKAKTNIYTAKRIFPSTTANSNELIYMSCHNLDPRISHANQNLLQAAIFSLVPSWSPSPSHPFATESILITSLQSHGHVNQRWHFTTIYAEAAIYQRKINRLTRVTLLATGQLSRISNRRHKNKTKMQTAWTKSEKYVLVWRMRWSGKENKNGKKED